MRKYPLVTGEVYHVMSKSIAGYQIFNEPSDYEYLRRALRYFALKTQPNKFSYFLKQNRAVQEQGFDAVVTQLSQQEGSAVQVIAYCIMPTHVHVIAKQLDEKRLSGYMSRVLNAYARYFNIKHKRQGPLWAGRFKNVPIRTTEQLQHVVRYVHLNPTTAGLTKAPEVWLHSSYREYVAPHEVEHPLTQTPHIFDMTPKQHRAFTEDHQDYQRVLAAIKHQILE